MYKLFISLLLLFEICKAQNETIAYQAILRNNNGELLINKSIQLKTTIIDSISDGRIVFNEIHTTQTNQFGLMSIQIGSIEEHTFNLIDWSKNEKFLKVEIDTTGVGNQFIDFGTQQLSSVPYALHAANGMPRGVEKGELLYWNDGWQKIKPGLKGQNLRIGENGLPEWFGKSYTLGKVLTSNPTNNQIYSTSANLGGVLRFDGNTDQLTVGICWSTNHSPDYELDSKFEEPKPQDSVFISSATGLLPGTSYYARAFVITPMGISYGDEINFTTSTNDIATGLVAYYPFSGNGNDSSGNNYHASFFESIPLVADKNGNPNSAIQLGNGYVTMDKNIFQFQHNEKFTLSFWFTKEIYTNSGRLVSNECPEGNFRIDSYANGSYAIGFGGPYLVNTVTVNEWHHFVYVYDNKDIKFYIDNVLVSSYQLSSTTVNNYCAPFTLGAKASSPGLSRWTGKIDQFRIYNRAVSDAEGSYLFENGY